VVVGQVERTNPSKSRRDVETFGFVGTEAPHQTTTYHTTSRLLLLLQGTQEWWFNNRGPTLQENW
jgi:putative SOS response-associated peptidase YedK